MRAEAIEPVALRSADDAVDACRVVLVSPPDGPATTSRQLPGRREAEAWIGLVRVRVS